MSRQEKQRRILQTGLILLAAALIVGGAMNGGYRDTWSKAIHICFECVGIG